MLHRSVAPALRELRRRAASGYATLVFASPFMQWVTWYTAQRARGRVLR